MRNLKKVLSLVLCLAMMLSIMVVGAGAAFNDRDQIDDRYAEAAEVLTNLGVLKGYEDGSFKPQGDITRAEVAAVIYRVVTSDVNDKQASVYADYNKFSDVKTADWFAGYVNFCGNAELIKGYGDGKFGPQDNITGYQALAMILRAVGYDQNGEFTGPNWIINTASLAESLGILKNVEKETLGAPATRELVAELIFQAMNIPTVTYTNALNYSTTTDKKTNPTLGEREFDLSKQEGVVVANEAVNLNKAGTSLDDGKTALRQTVDKKTVDTTYNLSTDISIIGENVYVWVSGKDAVSTPVSLADVDDYSNTTDKDVLEDLTDGMASNVAIYNNYKSEAKAATGMGTMVKAIDNTDDGKYDIVLTETEDLAVVQYVKTDGEIVLDTVDSEDDQVVYSNPAVGDVVLTITYGGRTYIEEADYVTGYISGYTLNKDAENVATIGGNDYAVSGIGYQVTKNSDVQKFSKVTDTYEVTYNGLTYNYYQDAYGNIRAYAEADELAVQYGLILDYDKYKSGPWEGNWWVKYLTVDNEVETAIVDKDAIGPVQNCEPGDVVEYRLDADGEFVMVYDFAYTDGIVGTVPSLGLAYTFSCGKEVIGRANTNADYANLADNIYYVDESLVAFYYVNKNCYGVLTGDEAIADLALLDKSNFDFGKELAQIDVAEGNLDHSGRYGTLKMVNISDYIDDMVGFCYIPSFEYFSSTTSTEGTLYHYKGVDANGENIVLTTLAKQALSAAKVWAYHEATIDGKTFNYLTPVEDLGMKVLYGDLHAMGDKLFQVYDMNDSDPALLGGGMRTLAVPAVYANVKGGTTSLSDIYCSTGYVVAYDVEIDGVGVKLTTPAVFVTDPCDGDRDYVDATIQLPEEKVGTERHLPVGFVMDNVLENGKYIVKINGEQIGGVYEVTDSSKAITVTLDWDKANVEIAPYVAPTVWTYNLVKATMDTKNGAEIEIELLRDGVRHAMQNNGTLSATLKLYNEKGQEVYTTDLIAQVNPVSGTAVIKADCTLESGNSYKAVVDITYGTGSVKGHVETNYIEAQTLPEV